MPELPEVEVVRAGLEPAVAGARVVGVEVLEPRSLKRHEAGVADFERRLTGRVLDVPRRRGKFLWVPFAASADAPDTAALMIHLGMSGQVLLRTPGAELDRLTRIRLDLEHPVHGELRVDFVDQRIFGSMAIDALVRAPDLPVRPVVQDTSPVVQDTSPGVQDTSPGVQDELIPTQVLHIARDPLDPHFDDTRFFAALAKRRTGIKRALLDQTLISGIGNIYADEALWAARIHYEQPTDALSRPRARLLLDEIRLVLTKALAEGGTSFDAQYLNVNGQSGYFAHSLNAYGQQGTPCPRCGHLIVREQFMNRGSHFCPHCQRVRRPRSIGD